METFPRLMSPVEIAGMRLRNRVMMTPNGPHLGHERYLRYLEERARGGAALLGVTGGAGLFHFPTGPGWFDPRFADDFDMVWPDPVTERGRAFYDDRFVPEYRAIAEVVHRHGAFVVGQLHYHGASRSFDNLQPAIGPSAVPDEHLPEIPREVDERDLDALLHAYVYAAMRVKHAGMDAVEIHAGHGYLMQQFLSPLTNLRSDRYGGPLEHRMRYLQEVLDAVSGAVGDFPIGIRLAGSDYAPGGLVPSNVAEVARRLADRLAYVSVTGGTHSGWRHGPGPAYVSPWLVEDAFNAPAAAAVRQAVDIPVVVGGRVQDPEVAERLLTEGKADLVGMVRALIADPDLPRKVAGGRRADVRPCVACNECHFFHDLQRPIRCAVNGSAGQEERMDVAAAPRARRVLVVGGGPAGMEAARTAAERGHQVTLYECSDRLGGGLRLLAADPSRARYAAYSAYLTRQLEQLGVDVRLECEGSPAGITADRFDVAVLATGSVPYIPPVPGIGLALVTTAEAVLGAMPGAIPGRVLVVGGLEDHVAPMTLSLLLAGSGSTVELTSEHLVPGPQVETRTLGLLASRMAAAGVAVAASTRLVRVEEAGVVVEDVLTGRQRRIGGLDRVVLCCGRRSRIEAPDAQWPSGMEVFSVGDRLSPRRVLHATMDGARVGRMI